MKIMLKIYLCLMVISFQVALAFWMLRLFSDQDSLLSALGLALAVTLLLGSFVTGFGILFLMKVIE